MLIANGLDNTSDSLVYAISHFALYRSQKMETHRGKCFRRPAVAVRRRYIGGCGTPLLVGSEPLGGLMISMALIAAVVNGISIRLLARLREPDVNIRAANTFSLNDVISNAGTLVAGALVWWLGSNWPDLVVGVAVAGIAAWGGFDILRDARDEHRRAAERD